jgi:lipopolysaccharide/colanic/teichoic acid biosynthesis glycosyltransferase
MQAVGPACWSQWLEVGVEAAQTRYRSDRDAVATSEEPLRQGKWWRDGLKLCVEWPLTLFIVALLSPLFLAIAVLILITTGSPVIYRRRVVGRGGVEFDAFKFRTMVNGAERVLEQDERLRNAFTVNWKLFADPRVTRTGRVLRKYSLDELPQLFNVLRGEMSLIGPRMISPPEVPRYASLSAKLLSVRPGLTGLWQVSGRQSVSYARRIELDMTYVDECSLAMDFSILLRTVPVVLKAEGAF